MNKEELLAEAARRYPKGTKFISAYDSHYSGVISGRFTTYWDGDILNEGANMVVYHDGRWAQIISDVTGNQPNTEPLIFN